jgi:hypothetical protein
MRLAGGLICSVPLSEPDKTGREGALEFQEGWRISLEVPPAAGM